MESANSVKQLDQLLAGLKLKDEENKDQVLDKASLEKLLANVSSPDEEVASKTAQILGDLARVDENRETIGELKGVQALVDALKAAKKEDTKKFLIRAIGNLAYEHADNRGAAGSAGVLPIIISLLGTTSNQELDRNAAGCLANLASDNETLQGEIIVGGGLVKLAAALNSSNNVVVQMAFRALSNLSEKDENAAKVAQLVAKKAVEIVTAGNEELSSVAVGYLSNFVEKEQVRTVFIEQHLVEPVIQAYKKATNEETKSDLLKCLAYLSLNDETAPVLVKEVDLFLNLLRQPITPESLPSAIHATMVAGNLARKDDRCNLLAEKGLISLVLNFLENEDGRLIQLALGALRNLAFAGNNRELILKTNFFAKAAKLLEHKNAHIVYSTIGVLRVMLGGGDSYVQAFLVDIDPKLMVKVCTPDEKVLVDGGERITFEGARILAILCEKMENRKRVFEAGGITPLLKLITSNWPVLQLEGSKALLKLAEVEQIRAEMKEDVVGACVSLLGKSPESAVAAVLLLEKLSDSTHNQTLLQKQEYLVPLKEAAEKSSDPNIHDLLTKILARVQQKQT